MNKRVCKDDQIRLIMECRQSGLSDYQWCKQNGIHPGNFYNWVSKLRKRGYSFPDSEAKSNAVPNIQEVEKIDLIQPQDSSLKVDQLREEPKGHFIAKPRSALCGSEMLAIRTGLNRSEIVYTPQKLECIEYIATTYA